MGSSISSLQHSIHEFIHNPGVYRACYLLGWGSLVGFNVWNSFVGGIVAFTTLPRQTFGLLQSRLIPTYLGFSSLISFGLVALDVKLRPALFQSFRRAPLVTLAALNNREFWQSTAGLALITGTLHAFNGLFITPRASETMFKRHRLQRIEPKGVDGEISADMKQLNTRFGRLHAVSSTLNVGALVTTGLIGWRIAFHGLGPKVAGGLGILTSTAQY